MKPATAFLAAGVLALIAIAGTQSSAGASSPAKASPPWVPFLGAVVKQTKSRDTSVTDFPIDAWEFGQGILLVAASDDPASFVAYTKAVGQSPKILARGPGPLTPQIEAQT